MTPLVRVAIPIAGSLRAVFLKLEGLGPGRSIKGRTARALVDALETTGRLRPDSILVESTSGNLGVGLAAVARAKGCRFLAVVDPKTPRRALERIIGLGATIETVREPDASGGYLLARLARVRSLCTSSGRFVWTDQYANPANPRIHELETGPEILCQTAGRVDVIFAAVSTGGTLAGLGAYFRAAMPTTRIIGVDVWGSVVFGGPLGPRLLTGIGSARRSAFLAPALYDDFILVHDDEAISACRALSEETGMRVGGSSGAVLAACARYLVSRPELRHPVCICPDSGENYGDTIYDEGWIRRHGLHVRDPWPSVVEAAT